MRLIVTFIIVFYVIGQTQAQIGGESTYQFLNLMSSPRQAALGGKVITNVDYDVTQALYNPATIKELPMSITEVLMDMTKMELVQEFLLEMKQLFLSVILDKLVIQIFLLVRTLNL